MTELNTDTLYSPCNTAFINHKSHLIWRNLLFIPSPHTDLHSTENVQNVKQQTLCDQELYSDFLHMHGT